MNTVSCLATIILCMTTLNSISGENPLKINFPGMGYTKTPAQTYSSGEINLSGIGIIDISASTITGPVKVIVAGMGRVIQNHQNQSAVTISGIGGVYNLKTSSHLTTTISGLGSVRENTWYPAWYLRNPWIGYIVMPILVSFLLFKGFQLAQSAFDKPHSK
jgi:hypothetical protein